VRLRMIDVQTNLGLKFKVNPSQIVNQIKISNGHQSWYELHLVSGSKIKLMEPIPSLGCVEITERLVAQDLSYSNVLLSIKQPLRAEDCPSVQSGAWTGKKIQSEDSEQKYKGEMLWGHKTAPELLIVDKASKQIIKDVDLTKIAKRR